MLLHLWILRPIMSLWKVLYVRDRIVNSSSVFLVEINKLVAEVLRVWGLDCSCYNLVLFLTIKRILRL